MRKRRARGVFYGRDRYAAFALGLDRAIGSSHADLDIFVSARGVAGTVVPEIDEGILGVRADVPAQGEYAWDVLLSRRRRQGLWNMPNLAMELRQYVEQLIEFGEIYLRLEFLRGPTGTYDLATVTWLSPETMLRRRGGKDAPFEQFVSRRAFDGSGLTVVDQMAEQIAEIPANEIARLTWPFDTPGGRSPAQAALALGREADRSSDRTLRSGHAGAFPDETFLPIARARAGAYAGALETRQTVSARIKDQLFYPGTDEAEWFPWITGITAYFAADRILRSRIALSNLREHFFDQFNTQVIDPWRALNGWDSVKLEIRADLFSTSDWEDMRSGLVAGDVDLEDVKAALRLEQESARQYGRLAAVSIAGSDAPTSV
ncbi:hypothetical protein Q5424_17450 [Conexibacter sp. JD483]|uniref:hypothetical protein n=1 Tax=unclassified Conexibacter TaxID=2627773 RepID=UPI002720858A|nr:MULTISPECIES: hypothetical protein [unclassified Conexibacter]MDO8186469.1 hypothetical protein [Conexibacter sp. CPCC 205706]MDO8200038.1 hypothetical protein [Conexibacter sp. CPCC 205762]MDR9370886.1 hypothetical protein [Conexibacter sp. JD483]